MLVDNMNVFPIKRANIAVDSCYYMDAKYNIYSNKKGGKLVKLKGSARPDGKHSTVKRAYTLNGIRWTDNDLINYCTADRKAFAVETGSTLASLTSLNDNIADNLDAATPPRGNKEARAYAPDLKTAIAGRGVLIASVVKGKLVFSSEPKFHVAELSWKNEMERLASTHPGVKFVALKVVASVVSGGVTWE